MIRTIWFNTAKTFTVAHYLTVVAVVCCIGAGAVYVMRNGNLSDVLRSPSPASAFQLQSEPDAHTVTWYLNHPYILKQFEKRCAANNTTMSLAPCQNVYSAETQLDAGLTPIRLH